MRLDPRFEPDAEDTHQEHRRRARQAEGDQSPASRPLELLPGRFAVKSRQIDLNLRRLGSLEKLVDLFQRLMLPATAGAMGQVLFDLRLVGDREIYQRKLALYRAGKLGLGLAEKYRAAKDTQAKPELDRAEKYLQELAGLEFGYKDVPQLLDKISQISDKG